MDIRVFANGNIEIVDEWQDMDNIDLERYDDWIVYTIDDNGCQSMNCIVSKTKQGHNGSCSCFDHIPRESRIAIQEYLIEENLLW